MIKTINFPVLLVSVSKWLACNQCGSCFEHCVYYGDNICGLWLHSVERQSHVFDFAMISKQHLNQTLMLPSFSLLIIASHSMSVCTYQGTEYAVGDTSIPAGDDCNVCTCKYDGSVVCGTDICGKSKHTIESCNDNNVSVYIAIKR